MKKFLSLILALTLVASLCAVNVMAASTARTATITADKTTDLKAGDTVVVSVTLDTTANICGAQYNLTYDKDVFEIDTEKGWKIGMKKYENFLDQDWYKNIVDDEVSPWAAFIGAPTITYAVDGEIFCSWAGQDPIDPEFALEDDVIGKYIFTVKDGAAAGNYEFGLRAANSIDAGENSKYDWDFAPITVTVGAAGDDVVDPELDNATVEETDFVNALAVKTTIKPGSATNKIGVLFIPALVLGDVELVAETATVKAAAMDITVGGDVAIELTAAIKDIPYALNGTTVKMVTRPFAYDGQFYSYGAQEVKDVEVNF